MDARFRTLFNSQFTPAIYEAYQRELSRSLDCAFEFRLEQTMQGRERAPSLRPDLDGVVSDCHGHLLWIRVPGQNTSLRT